MNPCFMQLHFLTSYPACLLNRDDAGFAKRIPFGGAVRTRISSQCLKRHWRTYDGEHALRDIRLDGEVVPMSVRSRRTFERFVWQPLVNEGVDSELARAVTESIMNEVLGQSARAEKSSDEEATVRSGQVTVLGQPEVDFLLSEARVVCQEAGNPKDAGKVVKDRFKGAAKKNLQALKRGSGLDAALFGRMVTSDILARSDAAVHVAHAFTVHEEAAETDYFSAVDDLLSSGEETELGSGHIGTTELTSGLFYGYVVVDVPLLVSNLEGCPRLEWQSADTSLAAEVVERLVHLSAKVTPGAKLGSTAPYARAHLVLAESGDSQPRTLANAFLRPVSERPDLVRNTYEALARHLSDLDAMYSATTERQLAGLGPTDLLNEVVPPANHGDLPSVAAWVGGQVRAT